MKKFWTFWLILGSFCLFFGGAAAPAAAQEGTAEFPEGEAGQPNELGIAIAARVGYDGFFKSRSWLPVTVLVSNDGQAVEGELIIADAGNTTYRAPVTLPTQSRKRIRLHVYNNGRVGFYRVQITNSEGEVVGLVRVDVLALPASDSLLYGVVSSQPDSLEILEKIKDRRSDVGVAFLDIVELPENPVLWRDLDVLIFNDIDSNQLTAAQRDALEDWLRQGGQLVVTGGASWQKTAGAFGDLLPVEITGSTSVASLPAFAEQIGEPYRDEGPYIVAESRLVEGQSLFNEGGLPILARRSIGRGATYFLALDPRFAPLLDWNGSENVWAEIARRTPRASFWENGFVVDRDISNAITVLPALTLPPVTLMVGFVLLYIIIIGPVNYMYLRSINRRERAWLTIPATIAFFTITAYILGLQFKGNTLLLNQLGVVTGRAGEATANFDVAVGLYSPRRGSYDIIFEDDVATRSLDDSTFSNSELKIVQGSNVMLADTLIDVGEVGTYAARAVRPLPSIRAVLTGDPSKPHLVTVTITNDSGVKLENVSVYLGLTESSSTLTSVGDVEPGATVTQLLKAGAAGRLMDSKWDGSIPIYIDHQEDATLGSGYQSGPFEYNVDKLLGSSSYYGDSVYYPRYELLESLFDHYGQEIVFEPANRATLVAWTTESPLNIEVNGGRFENSGVTLYLLDIPIEK